MWPMCLQFASVPPFRPTDRPTDRLTDQFHLSPRGIKGEISLEIWQLCHGYTAGTDSLIFIRVTHISMTVVYTCTLDYWPLGLLGNSGSLRCLRNRASACRPLPCRTPYSLVPSFTFILILLLTALVRSIAIVRGFTVVWMSLDIQETPLVVYSLHTYPHHLPGKESEPQRIVHRSDRTSQKKFILSQQLVFFESLLCHFLLHIYLIVI